MLVAYIITSHIGADFISPMQATDYQQALGGLKDGTVIKPVLLWTEQ